MAKRRRAPVGTRNVPLLLPLPASGKPYDIRERTFQLAIRLLDLAAALPATPEGMVVRKQLCRSGTSVGANVEEADGAMSGADRRKSLVIARKEAMETRYRLRIADHRWPGSRNLRGDLQEVDEIVRILSRMIQLLS